MILKICVYDFIRILFFATIQWIELLGSIIVYPSSVWIFVSPAVSERDAILTAISQSEIA